MSQDKDTDREKPLLVVYADGSVALNGETEAENEIAIGKALAALAYGFARVTADAAKQA